MRKWIIMGFVALSLLGSAEAVSAAKHHHVVAQGPCVGDGRGGVGWKWC